MNSGGTVIPTNTEGDFSLEDWRDLTNILRRAEPTLQRIAAEMNVSLLSSARWPELRLKRCGWWAVTELRLSLHPGNARNQASGSKWAINLVRYPRFYWLPWGKSEVESIDVLTEDDLIADGRMQGCITDVARRAFLSRQ